LIKKKDERIGAEVHNKTYKPGDNHIPYKTEKIIICSNQSPL